MDSKALAPAPASGEPADDGSASLECKPRKRAASRPVGPVESSSDVSSSDDDGDASDRTSSTSAIERALGLREIRTTVGECLALPDLAAFACVSRQYHATFLARLTAPCDLERLWALPDPFAIKEEREYIEERVYIYRVVNPNGTTLLTDLFGREGLFLHRARAKTIEWAGGALRQYGSLGRRVHPRLLRGFEADDDRVAGDNDEPMNDPMRMCDMDHVLDSFVSLAARDWLRCGHPRDQWDDWWNEGETGPWGPIRV